MIELKTKTFWQATAALGIASFFIFANVYFPQPLLPLFAEQFQISPVVSSLSVSLVLLTLGFSFFIYSGISDSFGRKNVMIVVMIISTIVTFFIPFATSFTMILVFRIIQAAALAGIPTIAMAYIGEEFAMKALTLAVGIYISANTIGGMGGRLISGIMTDLFNWKIAFFCMGFVSFLCFLLFMFLLPKSKQFEKKSFQLRNMLFEYKGHLTNRTLILAFIVGGLHFFVFTGIYSYITFYLSDEPFSVSSTVLGFLFMTYIAGTISSTLAGKASQQMKQSVCIGLGICFMIFGIFLTLIANLYVIAVGLLCLCFGFFFAHSCSSAWVSKYAKEGKGSASSIYLTSYYLGGSLGNVYLGFFWSFWGWVGVIIGSILILLLTSYCMLQMFHIEREVSYASRINDACHE